MLKVRLQHTVSPAMTEHAIMEAVFFCAFRADAILRGPAVPGGGQYKRLKLGGGQAYDRSND
jgi:hypothetical protein